MMPRFFQIVNIITPHRRRRGQRPNSAGGNHQLTLAGIANVGADEVLTSHARPITGARTAWTAGDKPEWLSDNFTPRADVEETDDAYLGLSPGIVLVDHANRRRCQPSRMLPT